VFQIVCGGRVEGIYRITRSGWAWSGMGAGERGVNGIGCDAMCAGCEGREEDGSGWKGGGVAKTKVDGRNE
jgi:hypothetical protein